MKKMPLVVLAGFLSAAGFLPTSAVAAEDPNGGGGAYYYQEPAASSGEDGPRQPSAMTEPVEEQAEKDKTFDFFTVALEVGYLFFTREELTVKGFTAVVEPRNGFIAKIHFDIGGDGPALEIAPLFAVEFGGIETGAGFNNVDVNLSEASLYAVGGYLGFAYRFNVKDRFFPHLGFGFQGTYLMGADIQYGTELFGRVPIGFTVYMAKGFAFLAEVGLMYGVTGIKMPFKIPEDGVFGDLSVNARDDLAGCGTASCIESWARAYSPELTQWYMTHEQELKDQYGDNFNANDLQAQAMKDFMDEQISSSIRYGQGFGLDIMIGFRFP